MLINKCSALFHFYAFITIRMVPDAFCIQAVHVHGDDLIKFWGRKVTARTHVVK